MPFLRILLLCGLVSAALPIEVNAELRVGAVVVDASPLVFPVLVNGGMISRSANVVNDPINARALVLDDGRTEIAIVVVDSCMMPRPVLDQAKMLAFKRTGILTNHILISATHTHSAPASMGCLGTSADPRYPTFLIQKVAEAIALAQKKLQPAQAGWNLRNAAALRRRREDPGTEDQGIIDQLTQRAVSYFEQALKNGFVNRGTLKKERILKALLDLPEHDAIMANIDVADR